MIIRVVAAALGIVAPALFLVIATLIHPERSPIGETGAEGSTDMVFYLLLILGALDPLVVPLIERFQISNWRRLPRGRTAEQLFFNLVIIRMAFVEATFIYGFVVYLLTGDLMRMLMFYPLGLIWLAIYWPRREKYERFIEAAEVR